MPAINRTLVCGCCKGNHVGYGRLALSEPLACVRKCRKHKPKLLKIAVKKIHVQQLTKGRSSIACVLPVTPQTRGRLIAGLMFNCPANWDLSQFSHDFCDHHPHFSLDFCDKSTRLYVQESQIDKICHKSTPKMEREKRQETPDYKGGKAGG